MTTRSTLHDRTAAPSALLLTALICVAAWFFADITLTRYFNRFSGASWLGIWEAITLAGQSELYLAGGLALFLGLRRRNRRAAIVNLFLFTSVALSGLTTDILKVLFGRARPILLFEQDTFGMGWFHFEYEWTSFPSGHSTTAMSVAVTLSLLWPRYRLFFLTGGVLVAASRVVLCQHYLSDVVAGSMIGAVTALQLYQRLFTSKLDDVRNVSPKP